MKLFIPLIILVTGCFCSTKEPVPCPVIVEQIPCADIESAISISCIDASSDITVLKQKLVQATYENQQLEIKLNSLTKKKSR